MTDQSPWASRPEPPPSPSKPANWGFFLLLTIGMAVAFGVLDLILEQLAGFTLPSIVNLVITIIVVAISGGRYLNSNGNYWTREDRKRVAFAYNMVNLVGALLMLGVVVVVIMAGMGEELGVPADVSFDSPVNVVASILIVLAIGGLVLWANYGIIRLVLFHIVNKKARSRPADISNEFA